jgi:hypothetical protein
MFVSIPDFYQEHCSKACQNLIQKRFCQKQIMPTGFMRRWLVLAFAQAFVWDGSSQSATIPRNKLFTRESTGRLILRSETSSSSSSQIANMSDLNTNDAPSFLQSCVTDAECTYPGCSDRGHIWGCSVGWSKCFFLPKDNDTDFCVNTCTDILIDAHGDTYRASFCPLRRILVSSACAPYHHMVFLYNTI